MKKTFGLLIAVMLLAAGNSFGEFVAPTAEQVAAAAADSSLLSALLKDATPAQAAQIVKDVIVKIAEAKLSKKEERSRIEAVVKLFFAAFPGDKAAELASELGKQMALIPRGAPGWNAASTVQRAINRVAGVPIGGIFAKAFNPAIPPPPPIGTGYEVQTLGS